MRARVRNILSSMDCGRSQTAPTVGTKRAIFAMLASMVLLTALEAMFAQVALPPSAQFGSIAGSLTALDGTPAVNVRVSALLVDNAPQENGAALFSITQTDASGRYRLENVRPGRYYVIAGLVDRPSYFPGVGNRAGATIVTVAAQDVLTGINFRMALPTGLRFSGRVTRQNSDGTVVPAAPPGATGPPFEFVVGAPGAQTAQIRLNGGTGGVATPVASVAPDGSFEFTNVRPGRYDLQMSQLPAVNPRPTVTLADKDVTDYQLVVPLVVLLSGTMSVEGGGPLPRFQLNLVRTTAAQALTGGTIPPALANPRINAGPAFTTQVQSGDYTVFDSASGIPAGFVLKSIMSGVTDLTANPLKVTAAGVSPIRIVLGVSSPPPWVRLSGRVVGRAERYRVVNFNVNSQVIADTLEPNFYLDGSFDVPMALPGQYMFRTSTLGSPTMSSTIIAGSAGVTDGVIYVPDDAVSAQPTELGADVRVSGRIVGHAKAFSGARVRMSNAVLGDRLSAPIYMDGSFEFSRVPSGTYDAEVYPAIPGASSMKVTVGDTDVRDLKITVPNTRDFSGRVLVTGEGPMPRSIEISVGAGDNVRIMLPTDGSFPLSLSPGQKIGVVPGSIPAGYAVESVKYGALDLLTNPISFSGSGDELRVTLRAASPPSTVSGRVVGFASLPSGSHVWLTDTANLQWPIESVINADGTFVFAGVASGTYITRLDAPGISATAAAPVVVSGKNVAGIDITAPRQVRGRISVSGNVAAPRFSLPLAGSSETTITITPQADGTFTAYLPIGEWRIGQPAGLPSGYSIQSLAYGSVDVLRNPLSVLPSDSSELALALGFDAGNR